MFIALAIFHLLVNGLRGGDRRRMDILQDNARYIFSSNNVVTSFDVGVGYEKGFHLVIRVMNSTYEIYGFGILELKTLAAQLLLIKHFLSCSKL